jgi:hypothetical protein
LGHHRPIGVESVEHEGVDEPSVGMVQGIDQTPCGRQFASWPTCWLSICT